MQEKFFLLDSSNNDRYSADLYGSNADTAPAPEMQEKFFLLDSSNNDRYSADLYGSNADTLIT